MEGFFSNFSLNWLIFGATSGIALCLLLDAAKPLWQRPEVPVSRSIEVLFASPQNVTEMMRTNPTLLTAKQCESVLYTVSGDPDGWLAMFRRMLSNATQDRPDMVPLFRLTRGRA